MKINYLFFLFALLFSSSFIVASDLGAFDQLGGGAAGVGEEVASEVPESLLARFQSGQHRSSCCGAAADSEERVAAKGDLAFHRKYLIRQRDIIYGLMESDFDAAYAAIGSMEAYIRKNGLGSDEKIRGEIRGLRDVIEDEFFERE